MIIACETDPVIYIDDQPIPVVYGIFSRNDSIHYLKVGRSFGAANDPLESARIYDSLFFKDVEIEVKLKNKRSTDSLIMEIEQVTDIPKDAGIFHFPGQKLYRFSHNFISFNGRVLVSIFIPGLPVARANIQMVRLDSITLPKVNQQTIYLIPDNPLRIHWSGNKWNEIDVVFEFIEHMKNSERRSKWVHIQNTNYVTSPHERYREMKITYEEFIREVLQQIPQNDSVKYAFFGNISIIINGGDENMVNYMKYLYGFSDYNVITFSNIENGIGLLASRSTFIRDSLRFDYFTRQFLINENRLKVLKISKWN